MLTWALLGFVYGVLLVYKKEVGMALICTFVIGSVIQRFIPLDVVLGKTIIGKCRMIERAVVLIGIVVGFVVGALLCFLESGRSLADLI